MSDKILSLFSGQNLSEELKAQVSTLFTEAVDAGVAEKLEGLKESVREELKESVTAELTEAFETQKAEKIAQLEEMNARYVAEELIPEVDKYLSATVNEWSADNKVAIEVGAKVQLAESFLQGLVGLAESHNMDLPKADVLDSLQSKVASLQESLDAVVAEKVELAIQNSNLVKSKIVQEVTASLSDVQKSKLDESVEKLEFKSAEQYASAVKSLVESHFPTNDVLPEGSTTTITEQVEQPATQGLNENSYLKSLFSQIKQ